MMTRGIFWTCRYSGSCFLIHNVLAQVCNYSNRHTMSGTFFHSICLHTSSPSFSPTPTIASFQLSLAAL